MSSHSQHGRTAWVWIASVIIVAAVSALEPSVALLSVATLGVFVVARWPDPALEVTVFLAMVVRPWLDAFSEGRVGLGLFDPNPAMLLGLGVLGVALVQGLRRARSGRWLWPDRGLLLAHIFLLAAYTVGVVSGWKYYGIGGLNEGVRESIRVGSILAAFLLVVWWVQGAPDRYRRGWAYLFLGCGVAVAVALRQLITGTGFVATLGLNRLQSTFSHPNSFGQYLVPFILLALSATVARSGPRRIPLLALAAGLTWLVLRTYSRTVLVVLLIGILALPLVQARRMRGLSLMRSLGVITAFVVVAWLLGGSVIRERFTNLSLGSSAINAALSGASENSYEWRLINWSVLIGLGFEHPILGHGVGMTTVLNPIVNQDNGVPYNAHNDLVRFFFETGFLGLAMYALYAVWLCGWAVRSARVAPPQRRPEAFAVAAAWLALLPLSAGNTELSLHTADLWALYGMLALMTTWKKQPIAPPGEEHTPSSGRRSL